MSVLSPAGGVAPAARPSGVPGGAVLLGADYRALGVARCLGQTPADVLPGSGSNQQSYSGATNQPR